MARKEKVGIIRQAIDKQVMDDDKLNIHTATSSPSDPEDFVAVDGEIDGDKSRRHHLLSNLLSQLESSQEHEDLQGGSKEEAQIAKINEKVNNVSNEEIIKELKNVRRQNLITHCLLSAMIVLTITWQLSEFSLVLKIRDGFSNPLKSVGGIVGGFLTGGRRRTINIQEVIEKASKNNNKHVENSSVPGLKIPLPGFDDVPGLKIPLPGFNDDEEEE